MFPRLLSGLLIGVLALTSHVAFAQLIVSGAGDRLNDAGNFSIGQTSFHSLWKTNDDRKADKGSSRRSGEDWRPRSASDTMASAMIAAILRATGLIGASSDKGVTRSAAGEGDTLQAVASSGPVTASDTGQPVNASNEAASVGITQTNLVSPQASPALARTSVSLPLPLTLVAAGLIAAVFTRRLRRAGRTSRATH